jgi:protein TonB
MFWIAIAAQLAAPQPKYMWLSDDDTPYGQLPAKGYTSVAVRLTVAPDGTVQNCEIEDSSGDRAIDGYTCALSMRRAQFYPATSNDGSPTYGIFRQRVVWTRGPVPRVNSYPVDLELTVKQLPKGVRSPFQVGLLFAVDENGRPSNCTERPQKFSLGRRTKQKSDPQLVEVACEQFLKLYTAIPAKDASGKHVRSVQDGTVRFTRERH